MLLLNPTAKYNDYYGHINNNKVDRQRQKRLLSSSSLPLLPVVVTPMHEVEPTTDTSVTGIQDSNKSSTSILLPVLNSSSAIKDTCMASSSTVSRILKPQKRLRPSLSQQLLTIANKADQLTLQIKSTHTTSNSGIIPLLSIPTLCIKVGTLTAKYPSPISFYSHHCEFIFTHPFETSEIYMTMYYKDMEHVFLRNSIFSFKIPRDLIHFKQDYDCKNSKHCVQIEVVGDSILHKVKDIMKIK
jgi:hypothetical protein